MKNARFAAILLVLALLLCACGTQRKAETIARPAAPTSAPSSRPTEAPTTTAPTEVPTEAPTEAPTTEAPTEAPTTEAPTEAPTTEAPTEALHGIRPEFQDAMDSYEAFFDEYIDFMKEYDKNPSDFILLAKYGEMMLKAADMQKKFDAWEDTDLSDEEYLYYAEVALRIEKKLLEAI